MVNRKTVMAGDSQRDRKNSLRDRKKAGERPKTCLGLDIKAQQRRSSGKASPATAATAKAVGTTSVAATAGSPSASNLSVSEEGAKEGKKGLVKRSRGG